MKLRRKIFNIFAAIVMAFGSLPTAILSANAAEPAGAVPASKKTVKNNGDGTYDITLRIDGKSSTETTATQADVVLVYDMSASMRAYNVYDPTDAQNGTWGYYPGAYYESTNDGNYIRLYRRNNIGNGYTQLGSTGTYDGDVFVRVGSNRYESYAGTRYENTFRSNDVAHTSRYAHAEPAVQSLESSLSEYSNVTLHRIAFGEGASVVNSFNYGHYNDYETNWSAALNLANNTGNVEGHDKIVIFISDGDPYPNNNNSNYNGAVSYASEIVYSGASFYGIGVFGDVTNMQSLVAASGAPASHYFSANNGAQLQAILNEIQNEIVHNLTVTDLHITDGITAATSTEVNGTAGNFRYDTSHTNWGNDFGQAEYNNGAVVWNPGENKTLSNNEWASVTFTVWPSQEAMDCIAAIRNDGREACEVEDLATYGLKQVGDNFELLTNTSATFTYKTRTETDGVIEDSATSPVQTIPEERDDTTLPETKLEVTKLWEDTMNPEQREDIDEITLTLRVDDDEVREYVFNKDEVEISGNEWKHNYSYAVAPGVMRKLDGTAETEGLRNIAKRIVTVDGVEYAVLEEGHDYVFGEEYVLAPGKNTNHYHITKREYHPMIVDDGKIHDVVFSEDGTTAEIDSIELTKLSAENTLNGGIEVRKKVMNNDVEDKTIEDKYKITITLDGADTGLYRIYTIQPDGKETRTDKLPYSGGKVVEEIQVNQYIRVLDVPTGVSFTVSEDLPEGYEPYEVDYLLVKFDGTDDEKDVNVVAGNASATATITNYLESGKLKISKEVTASSGNLEKAQDQDFTFRVNFYKKQGDTKAVRTLESFTLKHGESKEIEDIPAGWYYEVVEEAKPGFNEGEETTKTGTITAGETKEAKFKNNYAVTPLSGDDAKIIADKNFVSGYESFWLDSDEFTFIMTGNGEVKESDPLTRLSHTAEFTVNIADEGTYEYTISEKETKEDGSSAFRPGVSRLADDTDIVVTIEVEDNGDGTLRLVSKTYTQGKQTIYNLYEATGTLGEGETVGALKFNKDLQGRDWESFDKYTITIESQDKNAPLPNPAEMTIDKNHQEIDFGKIKFTNKDVNNIYNYIVRESFDETKIKNVEQSDETAGGISFTVKVTDNEDGALNLEVSEYEHTFVNIYTPDDVTTDDSELTEDLFTIFKVVEDENERFNGEEFVFTIEGDGFETKTVKITTATEDSKEMDGVYTFSGVGTYTFTVKETAGKNKEMGYDQTSYTVEIEVVDNPVEGKLEIKSAKINGKNVSDENKLLFTNKFEPEMYNETGELTVKKVWNGGADWQNDVNVLLTATVNGEQLWQRPATITNLNGDWTTTFTGLYKYENGIEIIYSVEEVGIVGAEESTFIVYGDDVTEDGVRSVEGKWTASVDEFEITNEWKEATSIYNGESEFYIKKIDEENAAMKGVTFKVGDKEYKTDSEGMIKVKIPAATDTREDDLSFEISEKETLEGYDLVSGSATVKVTSESALFAVDEIKLENTYEKEYSFEKTGSSKFVWSNSDKTLTVTNKRSLAKSFEIQKTFSGVSKKALKDLTFTITGPKDFGKKGEMTLSFSEDCTVSESKAICTVDAKVPTGEYSVKENNAEIENFILTISGDNEVKKDVKSGDEVVFKIKNEYEAETTSYTVTKIWDDNHDQDGKRPDTLTVKLSGDEDDVDSVDLSDENKTEGELPEGYEEGDVWTFVWEDLPIANEDAEVINYSATEELESDDYEQESAEGDDYSMTFVNVHEPELINEDDEDEENDGVLVIRKVWADGDNELDERPDGIMVTLYADGEKVETVSIMEDKNGEWMHEFIGLYKYSGGEEISYTVKEGFVEGYDTEYIEEDYQDGFTIINISQNPCAFGGCGAVPPIAPETGHLTMNRETGATEEGGMVNIMIGGLTVIMAGMIGLFSAIIRQKKLKFDKKA